MDSNYKEGKLFIIEVDDLDFVERPEDFRLYFRKIEAEFTDFFKH